MGGEKKTTEQLREEICDEFNWNEEDNVESIDKVLKLKKDRYTATQGKKKAKIDVEKTKKHFKTRAEQAEAKAKKAKKTGGKEADAKSLITSDDKSYLFSKGIIKSRTEMRHLEKIMKMEDKKWEDAIKDNSFTTFRKTNDDLITRRGSQLGASRGGSSVAKGTVEAQVVEEFTKDLPMGMAGQKKKE